MCLTTTLFDPNAVYDLPPDEFEELVAEVFHRQGFNAEVTQKTRDGGVDIIATFEMGGVLYRTYFECKQYRPTDLSVYHLSVILSVSWKETGSIRV